MGRCPGIRRCDIAITNGYATLAGLRARLGITGVSDTADDAVLEAVVESVSRAIDDFCGRRFYAATQTRYFTALRADRLLVDDLLSVTTLKTDDDGDGTYETTWTAADYYLAPYNAQLESVPRPYWRIEVSEGGDYTFPCDVRRGVEIAGSWGFSSTTPDVVEQACLFQAAHEFRSQSMPLGVSGTGSLRVSDEFASDVRLTGLHPVTRRLLEPYRRAVVG